jgi:transcriptional regulator
MRLNERKYVLKYRKRGLSEYKIASKILTDPSTVSRSRKNAARKLEQAKIDLQWARKQAYPHQDYKTDCFNTENTVF